MYRTLGGRNQEKDARRLRPLIGGAEGTARVQDHGRLAGLDHDDHGQYVHISAARTITAQHFFSPATARPPFNLGPNAQGQLVSGLRADQLNKYVYAGEGLTGGGLLTSNVTLTVQTGDGIEIVSDKVCVKLPANSGLQIVSGGLAVNPREGLELSDGFLNLIAPGTLSVSSDNNPGGNHTHAITSSSDPGTAASLLATNPFGGLYLRSLTVKYDASNYARLDCSSGGNLILQPTGDITLDPQGGDVLPDDNYAVNLGAINKKYLALHAAELWVETLVAQDTIATIGGRVLVGPTTTLTSDLSTANLLTNGGFETAGGGGSDVFATWVEYVGDGSIVQDSITVHGGTYSCKLQAGLSENTNLYQARTVSPGKSYHLEFWQYGSGYYGCRYGVYDANHGTWIVGLTECSAKIGWEHVQKAFTVPAGCASIRIYFYCPNYIGEIGYIDDVSLIDATIYVKHNQMAVNDIAYMEANGQVEFFQVISGPSGSGPYSYGVSRDLDGTGPNNWYAGDAVFNTGATGDGFIDLYSLQGVDSNGYGPTIVGNVRQSADYNDWAEYWAIGNLNGLYGYGVDTYGAAFGGYNGTDTWIGVDSTYGIRIMSGSTQLARWTIGGTILIGEQAAGKSNVYIGSGEVRLRNNTTNKIVLKADGSASFEGVLNIGTSGGIFQGTGSFASPTTALKIYNSSGVGLLEMWGSGTKQVYMGTDGKLYAGAGVVKMSSDGLIIDLTTAYQTGRSVQFHYGGTLHSLLGGLASSTLNYSRWYGESISGKSTHLLAIANAPSGKVAMVQLNAAVTGVPYPIYAEVVGDTSHRFDIGQQGAGAVFSVYADTGDIRTDGGLCVGGLNADPVAGTIVIKDGVSAPSTISGFASIYVDALTGDLRIRFGDGTIKTIVTDT